MSLEIIDVTKRFGQTTAVDHLTLTVPEGKMFGLLGANGAGKTTTFRMILGLLLPTEGTIRWQGESIDYSKSHLIGYLPEERGLYPKLKVQEQLLYLGRLRGMKKADIVPEINRWLERFHIRDYANKRVEELSKGNQQKIQFIAAVLHRPNLLILDEPFSGLDPVNVELLKEAVLDLKRNGTTIVFSSHRMEHVEELCEHVCILRSGQAIVSGALRELKRSFGRKNLLIRGEGAFEELKDFPGVLRYNQTAEGVRLQIANEETAQAIFRHIADRVTVRLFALEEPSLHDIFIEKVGAAYE
ncbi:ABC transporter ATP-binding protein [Geobacillus thermodenitrificans]|uniref:ABC transporter ATP-binding protein n=1 Tax=Geobacillus thermodenitrificans (strain NG80-2) TaxID=420246 RepID=A4IKT3_GEOTN|nr:ABC transporter ATP-binding protein [Geobacillus thermodenitrificans]ABO65937.1 ABC transporter ATP-binding protein [Geobacillus thermodenitrificans NG80-2]ARA97625.1 sodium ABC transporter ATP-binding protein [Geobacillus thermodenitrificans]MEC5188845.1 ABC-2 type transport system ATP-binding protein [Geobacillus thermodenitrificans]MED3717626.1 ABC transporter ATP-binding protein [Geobacillus thermodenitrificans]MED3907326.1 ABC transporter ATP-binding protein [Geobacillus thermodenitrif